MEAVSASLLLEGLLVARVGYLARVIGDLPHGI